jgi:hypothetical protein
MTTSCGSFKILWNIGTYRLDPQGERLKVPLVRSEDVSHDERRRYPLATISIAVSVCYIVVLYEMLVIIFDKATACQLYFHGNRWHDSGDTVARSSLPCPRSEPRRIKSFISWRWSRYVPPRRRFLQEPYSIVITHKTAFFILHSRFLMYCFSPILASWPYAYCCFIYCSAAQPEPVFRSRYDSGYFSWPQRPR